MRPETTAAIRAANIALEITNARTGATETQSKGGIDLVTATDVACEDAIRTSLLDAFPDYPVIGEERGGLPTEGSPYWLVDPICGTRTFASDIPLYCTNIALVESGEVTLAAIGMGETDEILFAEKGSGAWIRIANEERQITSSDDSDTLWLGATSSIAGNILDRLLSTKRWYILQFPSAIGYAYLAAGKISGIVHIGTPTKDTYGSVHTAAGCLVASEAGAVVTGTDNHAWNLDTRSFLMAATPSLHRELRELLQDIVV